MTQPFLDVSAALADKIGSAKTAGSSENIRCGRYPVVMINSITAAMVATQEGDHQFAFVEIVPLKAEPNPQTIGNVDANGKLLDDGMNPNPVGSACAQKTDFDGKGARSAGGNVKAVILALTGKRPNEVTDPEVAATWIDLSRERPLRKGDAIGIRDGMPVLHEGKDKAANPARGMILSLVAFAKKKRDISGKTPDQWFVTKLVWSTIPGSPFGQGENAPDKVAARLAEYEAVHGDEDDADEVAVIPPIVAAQAVAPAIAASANGATPPANGAQIAATSPPVATTAPAPPPPVWAPKSPWVWHTDAAYAKQGWCWSDPSKGGDNSVKKKDDLQAAGL